MSSKNIESTSNGQDAIHSSAAVARRRILLKGAGKGAAVLAATVPIQTLAGHGCGMSGMLSVGPHSNKPDTTSCTVGFTAAYWGEVAPLSIASPAAVAPLSKASPASVAPSSKASPAHKWNYDHNELLSVRFPRTYLQRDVTLFDVMRNVNGIYERSPERHWIAACLNALNVIGFPYKPFEVLGFYNQGVGSSTYDNALRFFTDFMEKRNF